LAFTSRSNAKEMEAGFPRQDHVWITTAKLIRSHKNEIDELLCKLDSAKCTCVLTKPNPAWSRPIEKQPSRKVENAYECCFLLLNQYWGIVTVQSVPREQAKGHAPTIENRWRTSSPCSPLNNLGCPDTHSPPELRCWLYWSLPLPLRTDLQLLLWQPGACARAARCAGESKVRSAS